MESLDLRALKHVDLSFNKIQKVQGIDSCCSLETLKLVANPISRMQDISGLKGAASSLTSVMFQGIGGTDRCPVCLQDEYKKTIYDTLPKLISLDGLHKDFLLFTAPEASLDLPEVPEWEQDTALDGILDPKMVEERLKPLLDEFEKKAEECRKRLDEGDTLLRSLQ